MGLHNALFRLSVVLQIFSNAYSQFNPGQPFSFPSGNGMTSMSFSGPGAPSLSGGNPQFPSGLPAALSQFTNSMMGMGGSKMPMVMMPIPSNNHIRIEKRERTKRRHRRHKSKKSKRDKDSWESDESSEKYRRSSDRIKKNMNRKLSGKSRQDLTPVVSYVTKDGYVVYQKKIQKEQASDWLDMGKNIKVTQDDTVENSIEASDEKKSRRRSKKRDDSDSGDDED
ncbi:hypothetical protein JYU34_004763 [Plutella xylostella]|uniref:Uncharacterized protein n=1 Tax=Plutella xylostella TaxID=51655 RepID=A0ABQ7QYT4_PLUXY|nr:hypothetical protein JYU34_004763 [Plutella xylostella]